MFIEKNNQNGATMVEMIGVLTIIIMLGVSSIKLIGNIMSMFKQSLVVGEIRDLQKAISDRYKFEGNYKDLFEGRSSEEVVKYLCEQKLPPNQMCSNGKMYHRMGGQVWVTPVIDYDASGNEIPDYSKYAVSFWNLTDKACVNAAEINWYNKDKQDIYKLIINAGSAYEKVFDVPQNLQASSFSFPVEAMAAMDACKNDGENQIDWVFY